VIRNHGLDLFLTTVQGQYVGFRETIIWFIRRLLEFDLIIGPYPLIWNLLVIVGAWLALVHKRIVLIFWLAVLMIIPREGMWMSSIPSALLIGLSTEGLRLFQLQEDFSRFKKDNKIIYYSGVILVFIWLIVNPILIVKEFASPADPAVNTEILEATEWLKANTSPESKVVAITDSDLLEWVPHLSRRTVVNNWYGSEWQPDEIKPLEEFRNQVRDCKNMDCVYSLSQTIVDKDMVILFIDNEKIESLQRDQNHSTTFDLLWENDEITIGELYKIQ
jgi:hypothetical protein